MINLLSETRGNTSADRRGGILFSAMMWGAVGAAKAGEFQV
ncbi:MAG: hypothetical protein ACXU84_23470 [Xanthobacteraceae bacterium]